MTNNTFKQNTFECDCVYPCDNYPECGGVNVTFPEDKPEQKGTSLGWGGPITDGPDTPHEIQRKQKAEPEAAGQEQDIDSLIYDLFKPAFHAADTSDFFRRGHHTTARKISKDQFYKLINMIRENLKTNFTITRKKP